MPLEYTDELSLIRRSKFIDFFRLNNGEILLEAGDGNDRVFFTLEAEDIEKVKAFLQPLESASADDNFSSAPSNKGTVSK